jgi:hypothetical protein
MSLSFTTHWISQVSTAIALDAPRHLQLEHIDQAFDYLCPPIGQPHRKHPSETQILQGL